MNLRHSLLRVAPLLLVVVAVTGCQPQAGTDKLLAMNQLSTGGGGAPKQMKLSSSSFAAGASIPAKHSAEGGNVSPALQWIGAPSTTKEFVLIVEDPDAPMAAPFVHWVAFRIPAGAAALPEDSGSNALVGQGTNGAGKTGYFGPKPPPGKAHRYVFQLFALNAPLGVDDGASRDQVLKAMGGKVVGFGTVAGIFKATK